MLWSEPFCHVPKKQSKFQNYQFDVVLCVFSRVQGDSVGALLNRSLEAKQAKQKSIPFDYWTAFPEEFDLLPGRITGLTQYLVLVLILRKTFPKRAPGSPAPLYAAITMQDFAKYCNPCGRANKKSERLAVGMIQRALDDLEERGFIEVKTSGELKVETKAKGHRAKVYRLLVERWAAIPYLEDPDEEPEQVVEADPDEEPKQVAETAPCLVVMPGKRSGFALEDGSKADVGNKTPYPLSFAARGTKNGISLDVFAHNAEVTDFDVPLEGYIKSKAPASRSGRTAPSSDEQAQPAAAGNGSPKSKTADPVVAQNSGSAVGELTDGCRHLGLLVDTRLARRAHAALKDCPVSYFLERLKDRMSRSTALDAGVLPVFAAESYLKWNAGANTAAMARPNTDAEKMAAARIKRDRILGKM